MSVNRNFTRTLSGANTFTIDNLELSSHKDTIRINGNSGNAGDVLGKDINNRLVFQTLAPFIIDPNSIDGSKLTTNIAITTTGNYTGNSMTLTGTLQVDSTSVFNNNVTIHGDLSYDGALDLSNIIADTIELDSTHAVGYINLNQHEIIGDYANLNINGNTGNIVCFQLTSKDSMLVENTLSVLGLITGGNGLTLTSGNILLNTGNINLTAGNIIAPAGTVECLDLETTGEITGGDNITITGDYTSTNGNITLTNGNISVVDITATNGLFNDLRLPNTGTAIITLNGTNGNINTDGNFTTTGGNIHTTSGNIFTSNGDIHANNGYIRGDEIRFLSKLQLGDTASPTFYIDSSGNIVTGAGSITSSHTGSYASNDFALELTEANSHAFIGGNLKVDGTIFGSIVGDVSETHINGQSLRIHDLGDAGNTGINVENSYNIRMYSDAGTTKTIELESSTGNITISGTLYGNVDGNVSEDHINGQSLIIENLGSAGNTGIEIHDGYDLASYSDNGITKTFSIDGATGDYNSKNGDIALTNGNITLTNGDINTNDLTATGNLNITGNYTSTNGNITLTNGDINTNDLTATGNLNITGNYTSTNGNITLTNGVLYGDVVGNIVEEHIDAQSLNIRDNGTGSGATGIDVRDGYDIDLYNTSSQRVVSLSGNAGASTSIGVYDASTQNILFQVTPLGSINKVQNILCYGTVINMVNSGVILMNGGLLTDATGGGSSQQMLLDFTNKFIKMRYLNVDRIQINATDIRLYNNIQTETIQIFSQTGNIQTDGTITADNKINANNQLEVSGLATINDDIYGAGTKTSNLYDSESRYFHMNGRYNTHTLTGTFQDYVIFRSSAVRTISIVYSAGFSNSSTVFTAPTSYNLQNITAPTTICRITLDFMFLNATGSPDLKCRIDSTLSGASAYASQVGGPKELIYTGNMGSNERPIRHSFFISGLVIGNIYSFYPKFAHTITSTNQARIVYGGANGDMVMSIEWLQDYSGSILDPYAPSEDY